MKIKVELDLSNYTTKWHRYTRNCKKIDLDEHKLEIVPTDLNKLSNLVKRNVFRNTTYDKLATQDFIELVKINFDERIAEASKKT